MPVTHDRTEPPKPATEPRQPEPPESPAVSIYEHFMGLQRLRGWMRNN